MDAIRQLEALSNMKVVYICELAFALRRIPAGISGQGQIR